MKIDQFTGKPMTDLCSVKGTISIKDIDKKQIEKHDLKVGQVTPFTRLLITD